MPLPTLPRSSQYKGRCTLKYLIGITPCGCISFVSDGYPGSITDDEIVRASGLLDLLERGDAVMADRGFTDWTSMRARGLELIIPALSHAKGKGEGRERAPFTAEENERTYRIANVRIHVERMMRSIKAGWRCFHAPVSVLRIPLMSEHIVNLAARMTTFGSPLQGIDYDD